MGFAAPTYDTTHIQVLEGGECGAEAVRDVSRRDR